MGTSKSHVQKAQRDSCAAKLKLCVQEMHDRVSGDGDVYLNSMRAQIEFLERLIYISRELDEALTSSQQQSVADSVIPVLRESVRLTCIGRSVLSKQKLSEDMHLDSSIVANAGGQDVSEQMLQKAHLAAAHAEFTEEQHADLTRLQSAYRACRHALSMYPDLQAAIAHVEEIVFRHLAFSALPLEKRCLRSLVNGSVPRDFGLKGTFLHISPGAAWSKTNKTWPMMRRGGDDDSETFMIKYQFKKPCYLACPGGGPQDACPGPCRQFWKYEVYGFGQPGEGKRAGKPCELRDRCKFCHCADHQPPKGFFERQSKSRRERSARQRPDASEFGSFQGSLGDQHDTKVIEQQKLLTQ